MEPGLGDEPPGLNDLALGFLARAIHLSEQSGESQWCGPDAQLAVAEVAIDAGEYDLALTALAHAGVLNPLLA